MIHLILLFLILAVFVKSPKFKVSCECGWKTTSGVTNHTAYQKMNVHQQEAHGIDMYGRPMDVEEPYGI